STIPGAWPSMYARWPGRPSKTGGDSIGYPASAQARQTRLSRCSETSDRYDDRRRVTGTVPATEASRARAYGDEPAAGVKRLAAAELRREAAGREVALVEIGRAHV